MADILVSTLIAFVGLLALIAGISIVLAGFVIVVIARAGDRPVELSQRTAASCAIAFGVVVGCDALEILVRASL